MIRLLAAMVAGGLGALLGLTAFSLYLEARRQNQKVIWKDDATRRAKARTLAQMAVDAQAWRRYPWWAVKVTIAGALAGAALHIFLVGLGEVVSGV